MRKIKNVLKVVRLITHIFFSKSPSLFVKKIDGTSFKFELYVTEKSRMITHIRFYFKNVLLKELTSFLKVSYN